MMAWQSIDLDLSSHVTILNILANATTNCLVSTTNHLYNEIICLVLASALVVVPEDLCEELEDVHHVRLHVVHAGHVGGDTLGTGGRNQPS